MARSFFFIIQFSSFQFSERVTFYSRGLISERTGDARWFRFTASGYFALRRGEVHAGEKRQQNPPALRAVGRFPSFISFHVRFN